MLANPRFSKQTKSFWASIRLLGQVVGYTNRGQSSIKVPTLQEIHSAYSRLNLNSDELGKADKPSLFARELHAYFEYRAKVLNEIVEPNLMDAVEAQKIFRELKQKYNPRCPMPMNKQKGLKKRKHISRESLIF